MGIDTNLFVFTNFVRFSVFAVSLYGKQFVTVTVCLIKSNNTLAVTAETDVWSGIWSLSVTVGNTIHYTIGTFNV